VKIFNAAAYFSDWSCDIKQSASCKVEQSAFFSPVSESSLAFFAVALN